MYEGCNAKILKGRKRVQYHCDKADQESGQNLKNSQRAKSEAGE
jgi:hypothetical protein